MEKESAKNIEFRQIVFSKADFWKAIIAGEAIALLSLPVLKNLGVFWLGAYMVIFLPFLTIAGLYVFYLVAVLKWSSLFQIGKYGIIGWLNVFFTAGIFNLLILITGIAGGWFIDIFFLIAFCGGVTNSFFWNKLWTFNMNKSGEGKKEYVKFFIVSAVVALVNAGLLHILINIVGAPAGINHKVWANIAFGALIPVSFFGNFFGYKFFVFKSNC